MTPEELYESRIFYRRRLAERLACRQLMKGGGVNPEQIMKWAEDITQRLAGLETAEKRDD